MRYDRYRLTHEAKITARILGAKARIKTRGSWVTVEIYNDDGVLFSVKGQGFYQTEKLLLKEAEHYQRHK